MKERILLHLLDHAKSSDAVEVPSAMTQEGIAQAADIDVPHFMQYMRPLLAADLVHERTAHVKGVRQRRKAYDLTDAGKVSAVQLRDRLRSEVVRVRTETGLREMSVSDVLRETHGTPSLLDVIRQVAEAGVVDLAAPREVPPTSFVEMLADAPQPEAFVGRDAELGAITGEKDMPRVFVVRGVAGIGKSSLGAKAADLLRGNRNLFWRQVRRWDTHLSILASLGDFLAALGKPGLRSVLARGAADRAVQVLREDLPGTQSFLVLDDAHEASLDALASLRVLKDILADAPDVRLLVLTREALAFYDRRDVVVRGLVAELELRGLRPEEAESLLGAQPSDAARQVAVRLKGHPLFLELIRASPDVRPDQALRDVRRFVEEEIYRKLSDPERRMMKVAALYRVAVPRNALFAEETLTEDALLGLRERSLLRHVGGDRYEVHEAVQGVFESLLTPVERHAFSEFAASQLRGLAAEAWSREDYVGSARCLPNALQLSVPGETRLALLEANGDALERMGDIDGATAAYREAMTLTNAPDVLARLHRKVADAYGARGEFPPARAEIQAGFEALGDTASVERGWLHLVAGRVTHRLNEAGAQEEGEAALAIFRQFGDVPGQADACAELGWITGHSGATDAAGSPLSDVYFGEARGFVKALPDPRVAARVHIRAGERAYYMEPGSDRPREDLEAAAALAERARDPVLTRELLIIQATLKLYRDADFDGARADAEEALRLAEAVRDPEGTNLAKYWIGQCARSTGNIPEARRAFEEAARGLGTSGARHYGPFAAGYAAECLLMEGDAVGYRRFVGERADALRRFPMWASIFDGFSALIDGRAEASEARFAEAIRLAERAPPNATLFQLDLGLVHFYHAAALRAQERRKEADEERARGLGAWRGYGNRGFLETAADREARLVDGLRSILTPAGSDRGKTRAGSRSPRA